MTAATATAPGLPSVPIACTGQTITAAGQAVPALREHLNLRRISPVMPERLRCWNVQGTPPVVAEDYTGYFRFSAGCRRSAWPHVPQVPVQAFNGYACRATRMPTVLPTGEDPEW